MRTRSTITGLLLLLQSGACSAQVLTNATDLDITKAWSQQPQGWTYEVSVRVPDGTFPGGFPVCILLHATATGRARSTSSRS